MLTSLETRLIGGMGSQFIDATASPAVIGDLQHSTIEANEDSVFKAITGVDADGNEVDLLAEFNMSGVTFKENKRLYCSMDYNITSIELASGTVYVH